MMAHRYWVAMTIHYVSNYNQQHQKTKRVYGPFESVDKETIGSLENKVTAKLRGTPTMFVSQVRIGSQSSPAIKAQYTREVPKW